MRNVLEYKGYLTKIIFSAEDNIVFGKVEGIKDLILFESNSTSDIECKFHDAVDEYLDFCRGISKNPDKQFRGSFNVRINTELHKDLVFYGIRENKSLNSVVESALNNFMNLIS